MSLSLDRYWMQLCLQLAGSVTVSPSPNPRVGSVIVQGSACVGQGVHPGAGHPHAEIFALRQAGDRAGGATLYVNLEPCNHYGRTPPCTEAILQAGIQRVVAGMVDPNPLVAGQGLERLRSAGVAVSVGIEERACRQLNEAFCFAILQQRSFGLLKYAMTLDGKIATRTGDSQWISSPESRQRVHHLRAEVDAIVVGGGTVWRDNPRLTARLPGDPQPIRQPLRVVLSRQLHLPQIAHLWDQRQAETLVFTQPNCSPAMLQFLQEQQVQVEILPQVDPLAVAARLYQRGCLLALWECGGSLAASALAAGAIQKVMAFVAPKLVGGAAAVTPVEGMGVERLSSAYALRNVQTQTVGSDLLIVGYLEAEVSGY
jgi:diaminohydroxyphosphoribosylaminopyrimidine deaminase/5-amino-6-(5-phosphoribosylamino)uracil reductase